MFIIIYIISLNLEGIILPNKVFKNFEIIKGSNSDFKKFSKTSDYLPFELNSLIISKDRNQDVIIPDESINPTFHLD